MRKETPVKPIMISPIPSSAPAPAPRPVSVKRIERVRLNWFAVGTVFGIGLSFVISGLTSGVVVPAYESAAAYLKQAPAAESLAAPAPVAAAQSATPSAPAVAEAPPAPVQPTYPLTLALQVGKGDTLLDMLIANHVVSSEAHQVVNALKPKFNPGKLRVGQKISVTLDRHEKLGDKAAVKELAIKLPNLSTVELQRLQSGGFNVAAVKEELTSNAYRGYGKVKSSLLQAGADGGIPTSAMNELVKAFSYDIDFQREIHPGDTIEVLLDRKTNKEGQIGGYENLRYAALTLQGKKHEIYRYKDNWYDAKGNSIRKSLLRTPLDGSRITSGFGMRTHPIMGYTKMHRGVDFGAPTGTPIMAAGDGTVAFKGWKSGYGNFLLIKHNNTYETAYGHISRFANIKQGSKVKQGQVIAYVGMTGMATGPHLHYEVRQNDTQVNPVAKQFNMASGLSGKQLAAFKAAKDAMKAEIAGLSKPGTAAPAATVASR